MIVKNWSKSGSKYVSVIGLIAYEPDCLGIRIYSNFCSPVIWSLNSSLLNDEVGGKTSIFCGNFIWLILNWFKFPVPCNKTCSETASLIATSKVSNQELIVNCPTAPVKSRGGVFG